MKIYNYNPITGELISVSKAVINPLKKGAYLIPANATTIKPITCEDSSVQVFNTTENKWLLVENNRGKTIFSTSDKTDKTLNVIGSVPEGYTLVKPKTIFDAWDGKKWVTDISALQTHKIKEVKAEAGNRILAEYPLWKQQNLTRAVALSNTKENIAANQACADYISNIQTLSDAIENKVMAMNFDELMKFEVNEDALWI